MRKVEYIIVGDGYAAMFFAHQLILHNRSFILFSSQKKRASQISAGVINPLVLKRFTTFWLAKEQIAALKFTLNEIESYTNNQYFVETPIARIFHNEEEKLLWMKKSLHEELSPYLNLNFEKIGHIYNDNGVGIINNSGRLLVSRFFADFFNYLSEKNHLIIEEFNFDFLDFKINQYKDIKFQHIVFAEGMSVVENPFFCKIPLIPNKGHHLVVKLSVEIDNLFIIKKKHFLFSLENGLYYYGGTYDREDIDYVINDFSVAELVAGLKEIYPYEFEIIEINYGFRPTVQDRRPIVGQHKDISNAHILNGLGARGILNGCYFAMQLFRKITFNTEMHPEVSVNRFSY